MLAVGCFAEMHLRLALNCDADGAAGIGSKQEGIPHHDVEVHLRKAAGTEE